VQAELNGSFLFLRQASVRLFVASDKKNESGSGIGQVYVGDD
jgi:hypothetical protein